jgi:hypothetical protein
MKFFLIKFRYAFSLLILLMLVSCQSAVQQVGEQHKTAVDKWQALANYAASDLLNYGLIITTKLTIRDIEDQARYQFIDIKLATNEDPFNINMLTPSFDQKYICSPKCVQFNEYFTTRGENAYTLLSAYFAEEEFRLFQFYADIVLLNDQLALLSEISPDHLTAYLNWLGSQQKSFDALASFSNYLEQVLSIESYRYFIEHPVYIQSAESAKHYLHLSQSPESQWGADDPELSEPPETAAWLDQEPMENKAIFRPVKQVESTWRQAQLLTVEVGDNVCSYLENKFGVVTAITGNEIEVALTGQIKTIADGLIKNMSPGSLFQLVEGVNFYPVQELQIFLKKDIAPCLIE